MRPDTLTWLASWFVSQANGSWEHQYGIKIESLDNPGWCVTIELGDTSLLSKPFEMIQRDLGESDWMTCRIVEGKFEGFGDSQRLTEIIEVFRDWVCTD